jgi:hypothetical protein
MENNNQPTNPFEKMIIAATKVESGARKGAI